MILLDTRAQIASASPAGTSILVGQYASGCPFAPALYVPGTSTGPLAIQDSGGSWYNVSLANGANVLWFGAKRDGSTDDHNPINAAIFAMSAIGGGKVSLPAGTYALSAGIGLASNIWLCGDGWSTVLKHNNATAFNVVSGGSLSKTVVSDLLVDGNSGQSANGIYLDSSQNCLVQRCYTKNVGGTSGGYHYWAHSCSKFSIVDCVADGVIDVGFEFYGTVDSTIENCTAENVTGGGIAFNVYAGSQRCAVIGCTASLEVDDLTGSGTTGIAFSTKFGGTSFDLTAANCQISGGRWSVVTYGDTSTPNDETASKLCSRVSVLGCNITGYSLYGVAAYNGVEGLTVADNSFVAAANCGGGTISLQQAPSTVRRVIATGNRSIAGPFFLFAIGVAELNVARNLVREVVAVGLGYGVALIGCVGAQVDANLMTDLGTPSDEAIGIATYVDGSGKGGYCMLTNNTIIDTRSGSSRGIAYGIVAGPATDQVAENIILNTISGSFQDNRNTTAAGEFGVLARTSIAKKPSKKRAGVTTTTAAKKAANKAKARKTAGAEMQMGKGRSTSVRRSKRRS